MLLLVPGCLAMVVNRGSEVCPGSRLLGLLSGCFVPVSKLGERGGPTASVCIAGRIVLLLGPVCRLFVSVSFSPPGFSVLCFVSAVRVPFADNILFDVRGPVREPLFAVWHDSCVEFWFRWAWCGEWCVCRSPVWREH